jgi:hypothetical protein
MSSSRHHLKNDFPGSILTSLKSLNLINKFIDFRSSFPAKMPILMMQSGKPVLLKRDWSLRLFLTGPA